MVERRVIALFRQAMPKYSIGEIELRPSWHILVEVNSEFMLTKKAGNILTKQWMHRI